MDAEYYKLFRKGDDDEEELTHDMNIRALKACKNKIISDVQEHLDEFNDTLVALGALSLEDKDAIDYSKERRGNAIGATNTLEILVEKDAFSGYLIQALKKCSLHDTASSFQRALDKQIVKDVEYKEKYQEYTETNDDKWLKQMAGENEGYKRSDVKVQPMVPRKYQLELAAKAMEGDNCLVCAPTNSGKTFVSIMIAHDHLKNGGDNLKRCVLFLVPRFALLQQIYRQYKIHLPLYNIGKKSGSSPTRITLAGLIRINDVIIATAEILKNSLQDRSVEFSHFSLLVFDECHHATKDHSYNKIMESYIRFKHAASVGSLPQIVGLTASPGAGRVISAVMAQDWILRLCANLDAHHFVTVTQHQAELQQHANTSKRTVEHVGLRKLNPFEQKIINYMMLVESLIGMLSVTERPVQEYINQIQTLKDRAVASNHNDKVFYCEHLCLVHEALCLAIEVRLEDGYKLLEDIANKMRHQRENLQDFELPIIENFTDLLQELQMYKIWDIHYPNPKLTIVKEKILTNKAECDGDDQKEFRAMIHARTRQMTLALYHWMRADPELSKLNTHYLTGIHASVDEGGLTSERTKSILADFDEGKVKVLVCTTVGEEGLNIQACRLSIRYNHVTNEISMIQARGRIREKDGHEVVIGDENTLRKDKTNVLLEEVMLEAMVSIMQMSSADFLRHMDIYQKEALEKYKEREQIMLYSRMTSSRDAGSHLYCGKCKAYACPLSEIRRAHVTNYVNPSPNFETKVKFVDHPDPKKRQAGLQKIFCAKCDHDWGNTALRLPCLRIAAFVLEKNGIHRKTKQWKKVECDIPDLTRNG